MKNNTIKIVINKCFGGFELSNECMARILELKGKTFYAYKEIEDDNYSIIEYRKVTDYTTKKELTFLAKDLGEHVGEDVFRKNLDEYGLICCIDRDDTDLVKAVEELGERASGSFSSLSIVEIPNDVDWEITEYDGWEQVEETHRVWG